MTPTRLVRFEREAEVLASLGGQPGLVRVHDLASRLRAALLAREP